MGAVVVEAVRTAIGKRNGALSGIHPVDLSALVLDALAVRSGVSPQLIDDVIWGCVGQVGEQAHDIARGAVLAAQWPESVPGVTVDRQCGSSQQSIHFGVAGVAAGHYDAVVAGGVESMSRVPIGSAIQLCGDPRSPRIGARYTEEFNQGVGAEMMAAKWGFTRRDEDEFAARSHERAAAAQDAGVFDTQILAVTLDDGTVVTKDEGIRRGTTSETLAKLKPAFAADGVIHAGNASQISDGAAAMLVVSDEFAQKHSLIPLARIHTAVVTGADPVMMLGAPIPATEKALARSGLALADIGVFEVNEAFAPVPMAWHAEFGADEERLNPNGGAIALGHPLGASGARIMTDMIYHMQRNDIRYGLQTMCEGGGQANATIVELVTR